LYTKVCHLSSINESLRIIIYSLETSEGKKCQMKRRMK
ncbi:hypothetical protein scyTo_0010424, partial [Scyliorhinus torazame]|nr:hypothetical protein [Scyliorhinus torazame]